jgi:hypothetical protein
MLTGTMSLASALILASPPAMGEKTDVLYFANGDQLTCEIKSLAAGSLNVSVDYLDGTISVEWSKVIRLTSPQLFIIKTEDGSAYSGRLSTVDAGKDRPIEFQVNLVSGGQLRIAKAQIAEMTRTSDKFFGRLNGSISSGFIYTKGNDNTQLSISTAIAYPRPHWGVGVAFNSNVSTSSGSATSTRNQLSLDGYRLMRWKNFYYTGSASGLTSTEQGIDLQTNLGAGIGRYLKNSNTVVFSILAGATWQNTTYLPGVSAGTTESIATGLFGVTLRIVSFSKSNLAFRASALPTFNADGRTFYNTNASYYFKLFGDLNWNLSFYGNWDTKPPTGYSGSDYGFSSGLGWTFGNW